MDELQAEISMLAEMMRNSDDIDEISAINAEIEYIIYEYYVKANFPALKIVQ